MENDILSNTFMKGAPKALRWVLFVPVALAMTWIVSNIIAYMQITTGTRNGVSAGVIQIAGDALVFIFTAAIIAPKAQRLIALILGILVASATLLLVVVIILMGGGEVNFRLFIPAALGTMICSFLPYIFLKRVVKSKSS